MVKDSSEMGEVMARDFVEEIKQANHDGRSIRAIVPCGPKCWYAPFARMVNHEKVSLKSLTVFHMDECLDWQGELLARNDPYNFRTFMETYFYGNILPEFSVPVPQRFFPELRLIDLIKGRIAEAPIDITLGGWGQDGHIAYNQARRHPFSKISIEDLRNSGLRIQENNLDTIIALGQRSFGAAYQFVPPMSITLGIKECLSAKKIRLYSDTGSWKQTALRIGLFSEVTAEYPITLLQNHPDALITATIETASHPISEHPEWEFKGINV
ncbi:glucosamine-6-phosphate deaminase [Aquipluma nitroreducens]|uniref:Glucosamine-6-phosphate deaminase n=2 Tax=Aquipluma nitroreducens TaxID=2010828 RepID=A0A5K7SFH3_9BACT|nr:glucosamine-6-phosphate deaminase [Aquipluma nitroreducens]